jgi:hypothetical protein
MNARLIGAIIALLVVVAVAATSMRLISFSFQEQASLEAAQTTSDRQQDVVSKPESTIRHVLALGAPVEATQPMEQEWLPQEIASPQLDLRQNQDEERKLAEVRRQGELRVAQARETELTRGLEEQRKATEGWWKEDQARRQREAAQLEADLKRVQEEDRRLGIRRPVEMRVQADKQPLRIDVTPATKSEGKVTADRSSQQDATKVQKQEMAPAAKQASSSASEPAARPVHASVKKRRVPACELEEAMASLLGYSHEASKQVASAPAPTTKAANLPAPSVKAASADTPKLRGTVSAAKPIKTARSSWQQQAFLQSN